MPLRNLGLGSARLLVAGLQRHAAVDSSVVLVDEVEQGLEPHRIARLLVALGAKDKEPSSQVFMTTHSPAVLCELAAHQIHIMRSADPHELLWAGHPDDGISGAPAKNARKRSLVLACFSAKELRRSGLSGASTCTGTPAAGGLSMAGGGVLVDAGGVNKIYRLAESFTRLGYRTAVLRDDDKKPDLEDEARFQSNGGVVFRWSNDFAFEDELFCSVRPAVAIDLCKFAVRVHGKEPILRAPPKRQQWTVRPRCSARQPDPCPRRPCLPRRQSTVVGSRESPLWKMRAREIVGPALSDSGNLGNTIRSVFAWAIQDDT